MTLSPLKPLYDFLQSLTQLIESGVEEPVLISRVTTLFTPLLSSSSWLPMSHASPSPSGYCQYLLYLDPLERFSIVSFVWGPSQRTVIHDHGTWGVIGVLVGSELSSSYDMCSVSGHLTTGVQMLLHAGGICSVSPSIGDIHHVQNTADGISISIHVYGGNIGTLRRHQYDAASGTSTVFVSGYSPSPPLDFSMFVE